MSGAGRNQDDIVFVPISTARAQAHRQRQRGQPATPVSYILVKVGGRVTLVGHGHRRHRCSLLRQRHRLAGDEANDFKRQQPGRVSRWRCSTPRPTRLNAWLLASVALVCADRRRHFVIMNIMLVSGDRADPRDRLAPRRRRPPPRRPQPVPDGGDHAMASAAACSASSSAPPPPSCIMRALAGWPIIIIGPDVIDLRHRLRQPPSASSSANSALKGGEARAGSGASRYWPPPDDDSGGVVGVTCGRSVAGRRSCGRTRLSTNILLIVSSVVL